MACSLCGEGLKAGQLCNVVQRLREMGTTGRKHPVIIDTDPGVDDTLAILLALASPELEILGFIVSYGNTDVDSSYVNILKIYNALAVHLDAYPEEEKRFPNFRRNRHKPILVKGASGPLWGERHNSNEFHGRDGLGGISKRHPEITNLPATDGNPDLQIADEFGPDVALRLILELPPRTVTYIALGPLTNLALMLRKDLKTVRERLGRVVCMGGSLDVPGNVTPLAESNFFVDPHAVHEILPPNAKDGFPPNRFMMLPLDITTKHIMPFSEYKSLIDPSLEDTTRPSLAGTKSALVHFTSSILEWTKEVSAKFEIVGIRLHDPLAVWCAVHNPSAVDQADEVTPPLRQGWKAEHRTFQVERVGEYTRGMLVVDRRGGANRSQVQEELETSIYGIRPGVGGRVDGGETTPPRSAPPGVACIVDTPGSAQLIQVMFSRIWGRTRCAPGS